MKRANECIAFRKFEIFSGTGGVGKTTLATSRAIFHARQGKKVLLITIDPAKRLKELMGLNDAEAGDNILVKDPLLCDENLNLYVQLMNPQKTIERLAAQVDTKEISSGRILSILSKPYGGLNEILSLIELQINNEANHFDIIVLDTPPGPHFLDFLEGTEKIRVFFDQSFVDIFNYLNEKVDSSHLSGSKKLMAMVVSSGVKKLLSYLQKVTGASFIDEFMDAVSAIYKSKDVFLKALDLQHELRDHQMANWFLITSVDQNKMSEALEMQDKAKGILNEHTFVILNKCLNHEMQDWTPEASDTVAIRLRENLLSHQNQLKATLQKYFNNLIQFEEILSISPLDHVKSLTEAWERVA